jgi:hypothetical protein
VPQALGRARSATGHGGNDHGADIRQQPSHGESAIDADAAPLYALHSSTPVLRYWDSPPWTEPARAQAGELGTISARLDPIARC